MKEREGAKGRRDIQKGNNDGTILFPSGEPLAYRHIGQADNGIGGRVSSSC